jgi:hypothetical protein
MASFLLAIVLYLFSQFHIKNFNIVLRATLYPIDLGPNKINNTSCNYLGSFFIEKLSPKKQLINMKTAVHTTDPS